MKIWIFINGWRLLIVAVSLLVITVFPPITGAQEETDLPGMELVEFLGDLESKGEDGFDLLQFIDSAGTGESSQDTNGEAQNENEDKPMQGKTNDK
ncbi:MAG TPA: hypothetical protein VJ624_07830 [Thermodesulfobacteriota bacterium]|nr:hypothetical protein [Thermodesulfobacteriota bacterium]